MENISSDKWTVCRICLKNSTKWMVKLSVCDFYLGNLVEKIEQCGGIKLDVMPNLPDKICNKCVMLLKIALKFRNLCQISNQQLTQVLHLSNETTSTEILEEENDATAVLSETEAVGETGTELLLKPENNSGYYPDFGYVVEDEHCEMDLAEDAGCEFIELQIDQVEFLQDESSENYTSDGVSYASNEQYKDVKQSENSANSGEDVVLYDKEDIDDTNLVKECDQKTNITIVPSFRELTPRRSKRKSKLAPWKSANDQEDSPEPTHICCHCGNIYNEKAKLTLHMKIHTKKKPHECEICHKRFAQTPQLTRHMNSHTGSRPFKCNFCNSSFADPSTCIKHQRIHTNERPYKCEECGKSFSYSNVLKVHKMTHSGERPYSCKYCEKKFSQLHHKKSHERTHKTEVMLKITEESLDNV